MNSLLRDTIARNRAGQLAALPSVCSAHPDVLRAVLMQAEALDTPLIVEATSNQVNQDGGYTGMRPTDFLEFVRGIADQVGCRHDRLVFGGDHLGPQAWRSLPADAAMDKARALVAEYAAAGFTKIHLDCAEGCAGELQHPGDAVCSARAADLAEVARTAAPDPQALSFMVGTEVPPPGGARADEDAGIQPTSPDAARTTMHAHLDAFGRNADLIAGLVVQPGVEFASWHIDHLPPGDNAPLRAVLDDFDGICFEAHSTDYQHAEAFARLAHLGFAVLKVGPALTFAYRQAVYALDLLVDLIDGAARKGPSVRAVAETAMLESPQHWQKHYSDAPDEQKLERHFSYSDRIRYYWPVPELASTVEQLLDRLDGAHLRPPVLEQVFSPTVIARSTTLTGANSQADALILAQIQTALLPYFVEAE